MDDDNDFFIRPSSSLTSADERAAAAVRRLENIALPTPGSARVKVDKVVVVDALNVIGPHAVRNGLTDEMMSRLVEVIANPNSALDSGTASLLVKALLPRNRVPESIVLKIVGCLGRGDGRAPFTAQPALLRLLLLLQPYLASPTHLSKLYGVLFHYLGYTTLRPYLCHILFLITRRKHVTPARISAVNEYIKWSVEDGALNALLRVYADYYPDVVVANTRRGGRRGVVFKDPDPEFSERLAAIQAKQGDRPSSGGFEGAKRRRTGEGSYLIPDSHTYGSTSTTITTLEEIRSIHDLVESIEKLELPSQLASVLDEEVLQVLLIHKGGEMVDARLNHWVGHMLEEEWTAIRLAKAGKRTERFVSLLEKIERYTARTGQMLLAVEDWLADMLPSWDGMILREGVMKLLAWVSPEAEDIKEAFLDPVQALFDKGDKVFRRGWLVCIGKIVRRWGVYHVAYLTSDASSLQHLATCLNACTALVLSESACYTVVLVCYEQFAALPLDRDIMQIHLPPAPLIQHVFFSGSPTHTSILCGLIARFKTAFELYDARARKGHGELLSKDFVAGFNSYVMDVCNCLWRGRGFNRSDRNATGFGLGEEAIEKLRGVAAARGDNLAGLFSLTHSPLFALYSARTFASILERQCSTVSVTDPVTNVMLKQLAESGGPKIDYSDFRVELLEELREGGLVGVVEFLYGSMTSLMSRKSGVGNGLGR
ncbi:Mis6-domain-containing protein [Saitoella complicata NRRL Y-17804]|uniref:Mis6 domain-containing protein n=1 Tax=Saitoella complicata (strain BCRC 22490 / CBS 7301 / JCM 7358 / NBRC 10748 / NRRL Y-17804) TaxID=698492 RepID=A0A0E9NGX2_SAICN|nr:Mis6-domain-containing protein [Saitoella complicata NRRL Y-17804]ODQ51950.1 Mis6-domain-containing protein [Saitoella complicata NRRL Y-17804]GAO48660.1 hypothetical protein G7K_2830-t1 [Saitoella complicata NRRL Y-17804]